MAKSTTSGLLLHQLLAISEGVKSRVNKAKTEIYKTIQKRDLFGGLSKTYRPNSEDGYVYPPESKLTQTNVKDQVTAFTSLLIELFDTITTLDKTNQAAVGNIVVNGTTIAENVPVSSLLFLEKQLTDIVTFFDSLPVLDSAEKWSIDPNTGLYESEVRRTNKTKKITDWKVIEGTLTDKHPAQVKEYSQDINEGVWEQISYSGAIYQTTKQALVSRAQKLLEAVVVAREGANAIEVIPFKIGKDITDYLTAPLQ